MSRSFAGTGRAARIQAPTAARQGVLRPHWRPLPHRPGPRSVWRARVSEVLCPQHAPAGRCRIAAVDLDRYHRVRRGGGRAGQPPGLRRSIFAPGRGLRRSLSKNCREPSVCPAAAACQAEISQAEEANTRAVASRKQQSTGPSANADAVAHDGREASLPQCPQGGVLLLKAAAPERAAARGEPTLRGCDDWVGQQPELSEQLDLVEVQAIGRDPVALDLEKLCVRSAE